MEDRPFVVFWFSVVHPCEKSRFPRSSIIRAVAAIHCKEQGITVSDVLGIEHADGASYPCMYFALGFYAVRCIQLRKEGIDCFPHFLVDECFDDIELLVF